ncbi:biotin-independent malonate decarboxylase subunit beta [Marinithermofilum abyssi]|uniref:Biotin-independent malonate decarboxylase subunit beta n=1 Tax=Marinithermofilum abyssi TaxID=1571185 RepID=A0A8J2VI19_9BACL|nr:biotin-independent malonate decarboxylase subunit beta [Marinithermofilum abyssi]GGE12609.1 biotin-independent malonate decarboxylase subunit beta [Marinithermofilum abyssi]
MIAKVPLKTSFIELRARDRAAAILDTGTFQEILGPFDRLESPHLAPQNIVPQSDDGVVVAQGLIDGESAVVIAIEGAFQGGGIGEVSGAKFAGALELALRDNEHGRRTRPVLLFDTGGVRLQEANYGLLAIAEIGSAMVALRRYVPVVGVIPGMVGCFGGMSITAGLCSTLIMTREGRLGLNGPEVIEQEAGIGEFDASDRQLIWNTVGGAQRHATGFADVLVEDDVTVVTGAVQDAFRRGVPAEHRSAQVDRYLSRLAGIDLKHLDGPMLRERWGKERGEEPEELLKSPDGQGGQTGEKGPVSRGRVWLEALCGGSQLPMTGSSSVLCTDSTLGDERVRYISVVPDPDNRFPRARQGEVGLNEGWTLARVVRDAVDEDVDGERRAIVAIVDVPSQAYGYREELLGIHQACAAAVDAYATARLAGHPVVALIVGNAISGAFLAHGLQANRILALDAPGVQVQVMSKKSAATVTRRSIAELEEIAKKVPGAAYDIRSFASLGAVHGLMGGIDADAPGDKEIQRILNALSDAIAAARSGPRDLSNRLTSVEARTGRSASILVRERMTEQWN